MPALKAVLATYLFFLFLQLYAESFRTEVKAALVVSADNSAGSSIPIGIDSAVIISLGAETRFLRGVEIEVFAPQAWLRYRGSLVMAVYNYITPSEASGVVDMDGRRIAFEPLPNRIQIVYHIPVRQGHGLRTTTVATVPSGITTLETFPLLFRLMPIAKGISSELENMRFTLTVRPILSDEGAVRFTLRYPPHLPDRPFTMLINNVEISDLSEQLVLREGEHHLVIHSEYYRTESRRFLVQRARVQDLIIELKDPSPIIIFEAPQNTRVYFNNTLVTRLREPIVVEPGQHEARFQIGDYTIIRTLNIQRGRTYRIALDVDLVIHEMD